VAERRLTVRAADDRDLEVVVDGPDRGGVLLFHSGTPSAAIRYPQVVEPAARRGLRTITYSRPGYASSTAQHGRSVADAAQDSKAILEALGVERFLTVGWSGGGPHALACAALLSERCAAAATIGGVAPYSAAGLDWFAGMGPENVTEFGAALKGEEPLTEFLETAGAGLRDVSGEEVAAALGGLVSSVDVAALEGEMGDVLAESFRRSVSTGVAGWRDDDLAFMRPWGFDLNNVRVPVAIWQGAQDRMVPFDHGRWLAANIPGARAHLLDDEGHLSLVNHMGRILDDLMELATTQR
jgi:pimeloyl-ACP methyl ester carboxylesterase